ncbi:MAG TPA: cation-transporting P-type ATPase [Polyangiaceae bacterium]|nr:cation-transporting P-type ATPase [Polyangiaceae bacterium]
MLTDSAALSDRAGLEGLSNDAAAARLASDGPNEIPALPPPSAWKRMAAQFVHFFALMLWVAGGLAVAGGMPDLGVAIFVVIVVNGLFAFAQEHRAEKAAQRLQRLLPRRALVRRDGSWTEMDAKDVVVGDVLLLAAGDRIPADVALTRARGVTVDTSTLTGESVPAALDDGDRAFAGTFVVEGEAEARVTAVGGSTRLASVAELTQRQIRPKTPLARELDRLVRVIALLAVAIGVVFFAVAALVGLPWRDDFLFTLGVAVALVPEGLLPTVTLSLAMGANRMAKRGALVRRLEAVETLGSTTFVCSDKTGTLTLNQMSAVEVWTPRGTCKLAGRGYEPRAAVEATPEARAAAERTALAGARASTGRALERDGEWTSRGDPMEAGVHALALRLGLELEKDEAAEPELTRFPFDPRRRRMSIVTARHVFVKGAPDALIPLCDDPQAAALAAEAATHMAERGLRVLAVASRALASAPPQSAADAEARLELLGLVGLFDPPRPEVRAALARCRQAGMRVAIVTGDHPGTARAVAEQVGLEPELVVTGDELPTDPALLGALVDRDGVVACRVSPEQKLAIAKALQARGHVVAMTGDGVNDGPALQQADVGVAMGKSGTDVARAAADLVLLDDHFETIVLAVEQGRGAFANIRRFLTYHLTDNVSELTPFVFWALSGGRFPLAIGVLQILCLDLLTDQLPALALGAEPPSPHALEGSRAGRRLVDAGLLLRAFALFGPLESVVSMAAFSGVLLELGWRPPNAPSGAALAAASGAAFVAIVCGQATTAFACRSASRPAFAVPLRNNRLFVAALPVTWCLVAALLFVPWLARALGQAPPTPRGFACALLAFPVILLADMTLKGWRSNRRREHATERVESRGRAA